jgi:curved DNA-binding protein CbpA
MADQINYYEVLGVSREASQTEIRNAYRNLAKERHPDHPGGSTEEFSRLQEANAVLSDPNRRRKGARGERTFPRRAPEGPLRQKRRGPLRGTPKRSARLRALDPRAL